MGIRVSYSPQAVEDLRSIWEWLAVENGNPASAEKAVDAILDRIDEVANFPFSTTPLDAICTMHTDWRLVRSSGYIAFFRVVEGDLLVDRILSSRSDYLKHLTGSQDSTDLYGE